MINNISYNSYTSPQFGAMWAGGNKAIARRTRTSAKQGANMIELIKKMVDELRIKAKDVPPLGEFETVWTEFENKDKAIDATHCLLKISTPGVKGAENERYLEVAAIKRGTRYGAQSVIGYGTTKDIQNKLNEQGIEQIIKDKFLQLSRDLEDV
jgi:hypothetical protein